MATLSFRPYHGAGRPLSKATFEYEISEDNIVQIIDLDRGASVTNDMGNVLADIARAEGLPSLAGYPIIYRDSMRRWDGVRLDEQGRFQGFYPIGAADQDQALARARALLTGTN